jgi:uncharacterized protein (TIGR02271 family)
MITQDQLRSLVGSTAYDRSGDKLGKIGAVYFDDQTDQPKWVTVHTGLFGTNESFVPFQGADFSGDRVTLGYEKALIKDAPNIAEDGHLSPQEEEQLYRHYSVNFSGGGYDTDVSGTRTESAVGEGVVGGGVGGVATGQQASGFREGDRREGEYRQGGVDRDRDGVPDDLEGRTVGHDTSGPTTDRAMTRSEEQLRVGTESREAARARLRKYVVTEQQQVTVPVSREEVTLEREPITDANRGDAYDGPAISEEEHEVVLRAERPVVDTEAVPVERVRLGKETITESERVAGEVRKEQIELDRGDADVTGRGVAGDRDRDGVPDSVDRHDDRGVGQKVKDAVTPDRDDRR